MAGEANQGTQGSRLAKFRPVGFNDGETGMSSTLKSLRALADPTKLRLTAARKVVAEKFFLGLAFACIVTTANLDSLTALKSATPVGWQTVARGPERVCGLFFLA